MADKLGAIAFVPDERLSREKSAILSRTVNALRPFAKVDVFPGSTSETELIARLEANSYQLVLVPWYRYLAWTKVEAFYGLTRTSGPTFAGYFSEPVQAYEVGEQADHQRALLFDFCQMTAPEITILIRALLIDLTRSGIKPLLDQGTTIYYDNWFQAQGHGTRMEQLFNLPEFARANWKRRLNAARICMNSFWSLIYEDGMGKSEAAHLHLPDQPKAHFSFGADTNCLIFRVCYPMPGRTPKDILARFWPDIQQPTAPAQLLLRYADFMRVHLIAESNDIEVTIGFFNTAPAERAFGQLHALWIEPLAAKVIAEIPYELPPVGVPHTALLSNEITRETEAPKPVPGKPNPDGAKDRAILEAGRKLRALIEQMTEKDRIIRELRAGGVGGAPPMPQPEPEMLLDRFYEHYQQTRAQIEHFESEIAHLEQSGASSFEAERLKKRMEQLSAREQEWIKGLVHMLEMYRSGKRKSG